MYGTIGFDNHKITCIIGAEPEERHADQDIFVDLEAEADFSHCASTDSLHDAIDYVQLAHVCTEVAQKGKYFLIEAYASDCLNELLKRFPIEKAWIKIKKPQGLPSANYAVVSLSKRKKI